jgi:hypothetical protein
VTIAELADREKIAAVNRVFVKRFMAGFLAKIRVLRIVSKAVCFGTDYRSGWDRNLLQGILRVLSVLPKPIAFVEVIISAIDISYATKSPDRTSPGRAIASPGPSPACVQAVDLPATGFIPVVLGILHYSTILGIPVVQNPENH